jgi:hypothetical protein
MMGLRSDSVKRRYIRHVIRHSNICICLIGGEGNETQLLGLMIYALIQKRCRGARRRTYRAVRLANGVFVKLSLDSHGMRGGDSTDQRRV